jgi:hypothetical protein
MTRWEDMTRDELLDTVRREHGHRLSLQAELKRMREVTKEKRDLLAIIDQLDAEVTRLTTQNVTWWKGAYENQLRLKRSVKDRLDAALRGLLLAKKWLAYYTDEGDEPEAPVMEVFMAWDEAVGNPERV